MLSSMLLFLFQRSPRISVTLAQVTFNEFHKLSSSFLAVNTPFSGCRIFRASVAWRLMLETGRRLLIIHVKRHKRFLISPSSSGFFSRFGRKLMVIYNDPFVRISRVGRTRRTVVPSPPLPISPAGDWNSFPLWARENWRRIRWRTSARACEFFFSFLSFSFRSN